MTLNNIIINLFIIGNIIYFYFYNYTILLLEKDFHFFVTIFLKNFFKRNIIRFSYISINFRNIVWLYSLKNLQLLY